MEIEITQLVIMVMVIVLVQLLKQSERIKKEFLPFISIGIGIGLNYLFVNGYNTILFGIFCGVLAAGSFDVLKSAYDIAGSVFELFKKQ